MSDAVSEYAVSECAVRSGTACANDGCVSILPSFDAYLLCRGCRACSFTAQCEVCSCWTSDRLVEVQQNGPRENS